MRYYVVSDVHGFFDKMIIALKDKGYFKDKAPHKLIICGDLFDRGSQTQKMMDFVLDLIKKDEVILIRGNHEDLMVDLAYNIENYIGVIDCSHHSSNGTFKTALALSKMNRRDIEKKPMEFKDKMKKSPFFTEILPHMVDYFETEHYVFVHGWVPCNELKATSYGGQIAYSKMGNWRGAAPYAWSRARWVNGMAAARCGVLDDQGKTIVCGHYRTAWGHSVIHGIGQSYGEFGEYSPYYDEGIIAIDGCTAFTKQVNCIVLDD